MLSDQREEPAQAIDALPAILAMPDLEFEALHPGVARAARGEGPMELLMNDTLGGPLLGAATKLLQGLTALPRRS